MRETGHPRSQRVYHLLLLLLLFAAAALAASTGQGDPCQALTGAAALLLLPALFLTAGMLSQGRITSTRQSLTLAAGLALLWAGQNVMLFWTEAVHRTAAVFTLWPKTGPPWLFLALAVSLPLGVWLTPKKTEWNRAAVAAALAVGCGVSCIPALAEHTPALLQFLVLFPLYLAGRCLDWQRIEQMISYWKGKLVALAALCAIGADVILSRSALQANLTFFQGTWASASPIGILGRLGQYILALAFCAALLGWMPRRRLPVLTGLSHNWLAGWFWLAPMFRLFVGTRFLPADGGTRGLVLRLALGAVAVLLGSCALAAWPVKGTLVLPADLTAQRQEGRRLNREKGLYWRAFGVTFLLIATAFSGYFIANGYSTVWQPDGQNLYLTIMYYTRRYVVEAVKTLLATHQLVLPQWDFAIGQGASILSVFHINPLFLLAIFTPYRWMELVYGAITVLQIPLAGWAFTVYCRSIGKREVLPVLTGAVVYACSGFVIFTAAKHIYFMTFFVIYLPLILAGCERWLRKRKWGLFVGMICLAMVCGYYYAYVNTLLMAIYLLIRQIAVHKTQIKTIVVELLQLVGLYLWGFALSMVFFLPSVSGFFTSSRSDVSKSAFDLFYSVGYYTKLVTRLISSNPSGSAWVKLGFAGIVFAALVLLFLRWRDRKLAPLRAGVLVGIVCLCIPLMGKIFNGFGYVTNRWSYGFAFCMALVVVCLMPKLVELKPWEQLTLAAVTAGYIALVIRLSGGWDKTPKGAMLLLALVVLCAIGCSWLPEKKTGQSVLALVTVAAILLNLNQFYSPAHSQELKRYMPTRSVRASVVKSAEAAASRIDDDGFWRAEVEGNRNNRFCLTGGYGTMSYWSVLDGHLVDYYLDFDLNTVRQSYAVWGLDQRASLCAAASVKYFVGKAENGDGTKKNYAPYGFEAIGEDGKFTVYRNRYALPAGYTYTRYMSRSDYEKLSPLERQQAILQCAVLPDDQAEQVEAELTQAQPTLSAQPVDWAVADSQDAQLTENGIQVDKANGSVTLTVTGLPDCETYVYFRGLELTDSPSEDTVLRVSGNGVTKKTNLYQNHSLYYFQRDGVTFNLGYSADGVTRCKLTFEQKGTYSFDDLQVVCLPMADYVRDVTALGEVALEDVQEEAGMLSGHITVDQPRLLTLTIPWQKGWTVRVNGEPAQTIQANGMYTGLLLEPGDYQIEAEYTIPGLKVGAGITAAAIVGGAGVLFYLRRRRSRGGTRIRKA